MEHQEGFFSNDKGLSLYYQYWLPAGEVQAAVFIVHGLHEHSGRYVHLASHLTGQGYGVFSLDFPGHGKSAGTRSYVDSYHDFINAMRTYLDRIQSWQPGIPIFLLGHSMGGLLSAVFLTDHQHLVKGAILSGSLVKVPDYVSDLTIQIGKFLSIILPKFRIVEIDVEGLSRDPEIVQAYRDDPLVFNGKTTARISNEINTAIEIVETRGSVISVPLLILHGGADRVCDPSWSRYLHDLVSSADKELLIFEGFFHEIYNEPEAEVVIAEVINWLDDHRP